MRQEVHAAVDDVDVQAPEKQERQPLCRRVAAETAAQQHRPAGNHAGEERVQRLAADPRLDAEPSARDQRAHQRRQVRADRSVRGTRENRERDAVLRAWMRVEQDREENDRVAEEDRDERLPPVHARGHQPRRQHVGRDAVRHGDPQRRVVVGRPVAPRDRHRREVFVVERARLDPPRVPQLDTAIRQLDQGVGHPHNVAAIECPRFRNRPSPFFPTNCPSSTITLPPAMTIDGDPCTVRPSYGL